MGDVIPLRPREPEPEPGTVPTDGRWYTCAACHGYQVQLTAAFCPSVVVGCPCCGGAEWEPAAAPPA